MSDPKDPNQLAEFKAEPELEAAEARRIILARRAQYVALAMLAVGAATNSCGHDIDGGMTPCLTVLPGGGQTGQGGANTTTGTTRPCLDVAGSAGTGNAAGADASGWMHPCLSIMPSGGQPGQGGANAIGGMTPCLILY